MVGRVERDELGVLGDAGIAGRGEELVEPAAIARASRPAHARDRPTDEQDIHVDDPFAE